MAIQSIVGAVSVFDARPFFEKALLFGIQHGLLDQTRCDAICLEAPKGIVQIARYFGSEFLRPELELARERLVNLVGLHLEVASSGDLRVAAQMLREHSLLSRSKAGADMLKALIVMPQSSHFGMNDRGGFADRHMPQLARWSLASYAQYQAELATRTRVTQVVDAALWLAAHLGLDADELQDAEPDAEAVIRTALLALASEHAQLPDWVAFEKMLLKLRKKNVSAVADALCVPVNLPATLAPAVEQVRLSVLADLPRLLDPQLPLRKLLDQTPAFMGRYFWIEDPLSEVSAHDRKRAAAWEKLMQGHQDDSSLLTVLVCLAAGVTPKVLLSEKAAASLIRKVRKSGWSAQPALDFLASHAPAAHQDDYHRLWQDFCAEAQPVLQSDRDNKFHDALALLRRDCNVA